MANLMSNVEIPAKLIVNDKEMDVVIASQSTELKEHRHGYLQRLIAREQIDTIVCERRIFENY